MEKPKTMQELIHGMDDLAMNLDWKSEEFNAVLYLVYDENGTSYNMFGHGQALVTAFLHMMVTDERFRRIVSAANESYVNYMAKKAAPVFEPIIRQVEKIKKEMSVNPSAEAMPCLFSAKFKPKS